MSGTYAGESIAKKVARVRTYLRAKQLLDAAGVLEPVALVLAGPTSGEVGCLLHILKPQKIYVVDRDSNNVDHFFEKTGSTELAEIPIYGTACELSQVDPEDSIDFASLDLMSNVAGNPGYASISILRCLSMWGIAAVTYLRGRETGEWKEGLTTLRDLNFKSQMIRSARRRYGPDSIRTQAILATLHWAIGLGMLIDSLQSAGNYDRADELLDAPYEETRSIGSNSAAFLKKTRGVHLISAASYTYQAEVSPMGVVLAQLVDEKKERPGWVRCLDGKCTNRPVLERRLVSCRVPKNPMSELLQESSLLEDNGYTANQVADIFDVAPGTLAAWKAHNTMGTYT